MACRCARKMFSVAEVGLVRRRSEDLVTGELAVEPPTKAVVRPKMRSLQVELTGNLVGGGEENVLQARHDEC